MTTTAIIAIISTAPIPISNSFDSAKTVGCTLAVTIGVAVGCWVIIGVGVGAVVGGAAVGTIDG